MSTVRIQVRRGTASQWTSVNPILAAGEMGVESDTNLFKFGNGSSTWTALAYANNSDVAISEISQDAVNAALSMGSGLTKTYNDGANTITISVDSSYFIELAQDAINSAFVNGDGITKIYNDAQNTLTVAVDQNIIASRSYVNTAVTGLANQSATDFIPVFDRGAANGVASLDSNIKIPNSQIDDTVWASKMHVASIASGLQIKSSVQATSIDNWNSVRTAGTADASGGNGVGEYLTASANGAIQIDGYLLAVADRVLLKDQTDAKQNGVYTVTNAGSSSSKSVLTRATDADNSVDGEVREGLFVFTQNGTSNNRDGYVLLAEASRAGEIFQLGTDLLTFSQFTGAVPINVGSGLTNANDTISINTDLIADKTYVNNTVNAMGSAKDQLITTATNRIIAVESVNSSQSSTLTSHTNTLASHATDIATNTTAIAANATNIAAVVTVNSAQTTRLTGLEAKDVTHDSQIADLNTTINTKETQLRNDLAPKGSPTFTGTVVLPSTTSIGGVSAIEIAYVAGVTSGIQAQIDAKLATATAASTYGTISNLALKAPLANPTFTGTVNGITKSMVGLGNVDNTADSTKPVSTAQAAAIAAAKSEALAAVTAVVGSAGTALDTLGELATALGNDASFATTVTNSIAGKVASYTTVTSKTSNFGINDADYHDGWLDVDSTQDITITVPADGTNSRTYPVGTSFDIFRVNTGNVTIAGSGATVNGTPGLKLRARYSSATLFKRAANTWVLIGDLTA